MAISSVHSLSDRLVSNDRFESMLLSEIVLWIDLEHLVSRKGTVESKRDEQRRVKNKFLLRLPLKPTELTSYSAQRIFQDPYTCKDRL